MFENLYNLKKKSMKKFDDDCNGFTQWNSETNSIVWVFQHHQAILSFDTICVEIASDPTA